MKTVTSFLVIVFVLLSFAGLAVAREMSGEITAVDAANCIFTIKGGTGAADFHCERGDLIKDVKVGDYVTVEYREDGVKKIAITVSPAKIKPSVGY